MMFFNETVLVTGSAGFIGYHLCKELLSNYSSVIGIDNLNDYYDKNLKLDRLNKLNHINIGEKFNWNFINCDLSNKESLNNIFIKYKPKIVINLAAQAGVRYSIINPAAYINSNIIGFTNLLECIRHNPVNNFIYASSSSVYGGNCKTPFSENDNVDHPISLYAATKKSNELLAHSYSHLYNIPSTALRFFTVYGPWGRPDMAPIIFANAILSKSPMNIFNNGDMQRDFTYIDDVINIIIKLMRKPAIENINFDYYNPDPKTSWAPHRVFNIGNSNPVNLLDFISLLENEIGLKAIKRFKPMQQGDIKATFADTESLESWIGMKPQTPLNIGVKKFIKWFLEYYKFKN
mgnify:CR=1 FL=1|tara:strand:+ start:969 stop:2012 length:1044 start_codon:yes stop_codon:yes gene_type:complete